MDKDGKRSAGMAGETHYFLFDDSGKICIPQGEQDMTNQWNGAIQKFLWHRTFGFDLAACRDLREKYAKDPALRRCGSLIPSDPSEANKKKLSKALESREGLKPEMFRLNSTDAADKNLTPADLAAAVTECAIDDRDKQFKALDKKLGGFLAAQVKMDAESGIPRPRTLAFFASRYWEVHCSRPGAKRALELADRYFKGRDVEVDTPVHRPNNDADSPPPGN